MTRFVVVGAGGVGGYFGGKLAQAGGDVTFLVRGRHLEALRTNGLQVDSIAGDFHVDRVQATDDPSTIGPVDAILMTVKTWQIPEAAATLAPLIGPATMVIPLENGMEAPEQLAAAVGREHVLGGLCGIVSFLAAPGHVKHVGFDPFVMFGELDGRRSARVEQLEQALNAAGVKAELSQEINRSMWTKFLFIAPMSAVGAASRVPIGVWRTAPETRSLVTQALHELLAVATVRGVTLADDAVVATLARYDALPPEAMSSLQRDVMEGKPSELDAQVGAVVRMARESGVAAPIHEVLYGVLAPMERLARGRLAEQGGPRIA